MMVVLFTPASCERVARERAGGERGTEVQGSRKVVCRQRSVCPAGLAVIGLGTTVRDRKPLNFQPPQAAEPLNQNAGQKANRVHPSIAAASEAPAASFAAGAERRPLEFKGSSANGLALLAEAAKGARGKAKGFPPRGAKRQGCGAGRGNRAVKPCIKTAAGPKYKCRRRWCAVCVCLRRVRYGFVGVSRRPRTPHALF